jgi:hypothetical protein
MGTGPDIELSIPPKLLAMQIYMDIIRHSQISCLRTNVPHDFVDIVIFHRGGVQLTYMYTLLKMLGYPQVGAYTGRWDGWHMPSQ